MITTAIVWDHRGRAPKGQEGPLEVRVTVDRKPYYINSGVRVRKEEWQFGAVVDRYDCTELNERLMLVAKAVQKEVNKCLKDKKPINVKEIRERVWQFVEKDGTGQTFLNWFESQIPNIKAGIRTKQRYGVTLRRLRAFGRMKEWDEVTPERIAEFDKWLHRSLKGTRRRGDKPIGDASVYTYHKHLKKILGLAIRAGIIDKSPYERLPTFSKGVKESVEYLTEDEMRKIMDLPLEGERVEMARDLFVFQMFTGLSYADTQRFDFDKYKKEDGRYVSVSSRVKTGVPYVSVLLPPAVAVLKKYGWETPKIINWKYNVCLKMIGELAGIKTEMHSHLARHTFATMMLRHGAKVENVARMLGHTKLEQTMRYAKVMAESVRDDFDRIEKDFFQ